MSSNNNPATMWPDDTEPPGCPDWAKLNNTAHSPRYTSSNRFKAARSSGIASAGSDTSTHVARRGPNAGFVITSTPQLARSMAVHTRLPAVCPMHLRQPTFSPIVDSTGWRRAPANLSEPLVPSFQASGYQIRATSYQLPDRDHRLHLGPRPHHEVPPANPTTDRRPRLREGRKRTRRSGARALPAQSSRLVAGSW